MGVRELGRRRKRKRGSCFVDGLCLCVSESGEDTASNGKGSLSRSLALSRHTKPAYFGPSPRRTMAAADAATHPLQDKLDRGIELEDAKPDEAVAIFDEILADTSACRRIGRRTRRRARLPPNPARPHGPGGPSREEKTPMASCSARSSVAPRDPSPTSSSRAATERNVELARRRPRSRLPAPPPRRRSPRPPLPAATRDDAVSKVKEQAIYKLGALHAKLRCVLAVLVSVSRSPLAAFHAPFPSRRSARAPQERGRTREARARRAPVLLDDPEGQDRQDRPHPHRHGRPHPRHARRPGRALPRVGRLVPRREAQLPPPPHPVQARQPVRQPGGPSDATPARIVIRRPLVPFVSL